MSLLSTALIATNGCSVSDFTYPLISLSVVEDKGTP